ncbi:Tetratricopeptide repeat-containing protein [Thalassobacillus cyri]|uniref:Tetratricopeptide repeat-containing protein n=2 Tax=Thalassobacillus cyri TaxID=571932 RepID=A0A1H4DVG3_9BACI|nr:Tetratricopeptide repeat-containing protein [Thalassobacillus cyri]
MNIGNRLNYLQQTKNCIAPDFQHGPILEKEWEAILQGQLPLSGEQAAYLAEQWNLPVDYLVDYDATDIAIHRELQRIQHELLTNDDKAKQRLVQLGGTYAIPSIMQETIFKLLQAVNYYKINQPKDAEEIEEGYLSFMLPGFNVLKEIGVFQKALFYYYGFKYYYEGEKEESFSYFERILEKTQDTEEVISLMQNLSLIAKDSKEYDCAINYMNRLETFSSEHGSNRGLAIAWNYLGVLYLLKKNYPTAIQYFEKMKTLELNPLMQSRMYHNLGVLYGEKQYYHEAIKMFSKSKKVKESNQMTEDLFLSYHALARNYFLTGQPAEAKHYLTFAQQTAANEDERSLAKMAEAEMIKASYPKAAIDLYVQAVNYYEKVQFIGELDDLYPTLIRLFEQVGDPAMALEFRQRYQSLHVDKDESKHA